MFQDWILSQFQHFNFLTIIIMITFVTTMSKANTTKLLKDQSEELYKDFEELKDELRNSENNLSTLIIASKEKTK